MKKTIFICVSLVLLVVLSFSFKTTGKTPEKITICHIPPGNPGNCHEITISVKALETHFEHHGDVLVCHNANEWDAYIVISHTTRLPLERAF